MIRQSGDPLTDFVKGFSGGKRAVFALLAASTHDPDAVKITHCWETIKRTMVGAHAGNITLRAVVDEAEMHDRDFVALVHRCCWDFELERAKVKYAQRYSAMMDVSLARAMDPDATREREIHFQASGHLPPSKGIQVAMFQQNNTSTKDPEPGEAPSVSRTARRIVRDLPPAS